MSVNAEGSRKNIKHKWFETGSTSAATRRNVVCQDAALASEMQVHITAGLLLSLDNNCDKG